MSNNQQANNQPLTIDQLDRLYHQYCDGREGRKGYEQEEYATDREFAQREVGDFLDWLEERLTGERPQPDTTVRYHRNTQQ